MKTLFISALLIFSIYASAQTITQNNLCFDWVLKKGWFGEEYIVFEKFDSAKYVTQNSYNIVDVFKFTEKGIFLKKTYDPKKYIFCGNGMLYFASSTWKLSGNKIYFDLKGGHFDEDKFHYEMIYIVKKISGDSLELKRKKVISQSVRPEHEMPQNTR